jgi:hypothetical protein
MKIKTLKESVWIKKFAWTPKTVWDSLLSHRVTEEGRVYGKIVWLETYYKRHDLEGNYSKELKKSL